MPLCAPAALAGQDWALSADPSSCAGAADVEEHCWAPAALGPLKHSSPWERALPKVPFLTTAFHFSQKFWVGMFFCWFKCKERGFPYLSTSSAWSLSSCAFSGSCFITNNNKSFLNKRDLEALAFSAFKCGDYYLNSCGPESSFPVWHPPSVASAQLRKKQAWAFPTVRISRALSHPGPALCAYNTEIFHLFTGHPTVFYLHSIHLFPGSLSVFYWLCLWGSFLSISSFCS